MFLRSFRILEAHLTCSWHPFDPLAWLCIPIGLYMNAKPIWCDQKAFNTGPKWTCSFKKDFNLNFMQCIQLPNQKYKSTYVYMVLTSWKAYRMLVHTSADLKLRDFKATYHCSLQLDLSLCKSQWNHKVVQEPFEDVASWVAMIWMVPLPAMGWDLSCGFELSNRITNLTGLHTYRYLF